MIAHPKPTKADRGRPKARGSKRTPPSLSGFYAFAATHPCCICGNPDVELHHLAHIPSLRTHEYLPRRKAHAAAIVVAVLVFITLAVRP